MSEEEPIVEPFPVVRIAHIDASQPEPRWLVASLWGEQSVGFIGGTPKSYKTWLALELAIAVASGRPCLGRFAVHHPGPVLLYTAEDGAIAIRRRVAAIAVARKLDLNRLAVGLITEPTLKLDVPSHQYRLTATLEKVKPRLLILDPLVRLHSGDENSATDVSRLLAFLRGLQREHKVAIAVVHHIRKAATGGQPGQSLRGSGDLHAWSDSNLFLLHRNDRLELHAEHRNHPSPPPLVVKLATSPEHLTVQDISHNISDAKGNGWMSKVLEVLERGPRTRASLREELRIRNETLGEILVELENRGEVQRIDGRLSVPRSGT